MTNREDRDLHAFMADIIDNAVFSGPDAVEGPGAAQLPGAVRHRRFGKVFDLLQNTRNPLVRHACKVFLNAGLKKIL